jgi:hypothetical protein
MPQKVSEMPEIGGIVCTGDFHKISEIIDEALHGRKPVYVGNPVFTFVARMPRLLSLIAQLGEGRRVRITHAYEYDLSGEGIA